MKDNKVSIFSECSAEEYDGKEKKHCIVTSQEEEGLLMSWQSSQNTLALVWQQGLGKDVSMFKHPQKMLQSQFHFFQLTNTQKSNMLLGGHYGGTLVYSDVAAPKVSSSSCITSKMA